MLLRHNRDRNDPKITLACDQIRLALEGIDRRTTHGGLNGAEGSATASYFRGLRRLFNPEWRFQDRNRRPPREPVNVLLSFGYTLLTQLTASAAQTVGLDPYAGSRHEVVYNRPALALDLLEEFRPLVDGIVLWCCNSHQLTPADFSPGPPERPVILEQVGQKRFLQAFENRLEQRYTHPVRGEQLTIRQCLVEQARQVAHCITTGKLEFQHMGFH